MYSKLALVLLLYARASQAKHGVHDGNDKESDADDDDAAAPPPSNTTRASTSIISSTPAFTPSPSSSLSPAPTPSSFQWVNPSNATTCHNATFTWHLTSNMTFALTLTVTNERVAQQGPGISPMPHIDGALVTRTISTAISPKAQIMVWATVDVPEGWYAAIAFDTDHTINMFSRSQPFFVKNGTDVSCLAASLAPTSSTALSSTTTPSATSADAPPTNHGSLSTPELIGTIAAVVVGISLIAIAFTFPRIWRKFLPSRPPKRPGGPYLLY